MDETLKQLGELALGAIPTIILFVLIWILYRVIVHNALAGALRERRSKTSGAVEKAKIDIAAAERKTAEYDHQLREARLAAFKALEGRRQQILEQKMIAIAEAKTAAEVRVAAARAEIEKETNVAKIRVKDETSNLAKDIIRAILRAGLGAKQPVMGGRG